MSEVFDEQYWQAIAIGDEESQRHHMHGTPSHLPVLVGRAVPLDKVLATLPVQAPRTYEDELRCMVPTLRLQ